MSRLCGHKAVLSAAAALLQVSPASSVLGFDQRRWSRYGAMVIAASADHPRGWAG